MKGKYKANDPELIQKLKILELPDFSDNELCVTPKLNTVLVKSVNADRRNEAEKAEDLEKIEEVVLENTTITQNDVEEVSVSLENPNKIITLGVIAAIVISLTCIVTIILINKTSKKDKKEDK